MADMTDVFFFSSRRRHTISLRDWSSDVCSSDLDLLASEARLASFVSIAQGQAPQESWFALGRLLSSTGGDTVLVSWSGSMFEYLMPRSEERRVGKECSSRWWAYVLGEKSQGTWF